MKMTIEQVADYCGVSEQSAYGLMQYLKEIGHVEVTEAPSNGKRGRRPKLYELSAVAMQQINVLDPERHNAPPVNLQLSPEATDLIGTLSGVGVG